MNLDLARERVPRRAVRRVVRVVAGIVAVEFVASVLSAFAFVVWLSWAFGTDATFGEWARAFGEIAWEMAGSFVAFEFGRMLYSGGLPTSWGGWLLVAGIAGSYVLAAGLVVFGSRVLFSDA